MGTIASSTGAFHQPGTPLRSQPEPGDIVLFADAEGLNRLITLLTRSKYYHVAIYSGNSHVVEARPQGVIERDLNGPEGTQISAFIPIKDEKGVAALQWARGEIGGKYDRFDLVVMFLERIFKHLHLNYAPKDKFSCGEFVAEAFRAEGANLLPALDPAEVVPGDFEQLHPIPVGEFGKEKAAQ